MKTKRITVFVLIAVMLFTFAFGTFAEARTSGNASYSAGRVKSTVDRSTHTKDWSGH